METQLLYSYAKFRKLSRFEKRQLLNQLISEKLDMRCEARIYRVVTRLTFQSLRKKYELRYEHTLDEKRIGNLLKEVGIANSTALQWYYSTFKENPLKLVKGECKDDPTGAICECSIDDSVKENIERKYEYRLASKRLYQAIVKAELFRSALAKAGRSISDGEIRHSLRRIVQQQYYTKGIRKETIEKFRELDSIVRKVLGQRNIGAMAVLNKFYLIMHHPELLKKVQRNEISPDAVFEKTMEYLKDDINGGAV